MTIRRIVPDLEVTDPAAGGSFYEDVLGLELAMDLDAGALGRAALLRA